MLRQLSLALDLPSRRPDTGQKPARRDVLYFALLPDPVTAASIAKLRQELRAKYGLTGQVRSSELLHLSLNGVGKFDAVPPQIISAAVKAGAAVRAAPFEMTFDRMMSFRGKSAPLVLRCRDGLAALTALHKALSAEMARMGLKSGIGSAFTPHVTLLYDRKVVPQSPLDHPVGWKVRDFALVHSLHGKGRHLHLARWPLRE